MANRNYDNVQILGKGRKIIAGSFLPNGGSAIAADSAWNGFSVARTGAGQFTITLTDSYLALVSAVATIQMNSATDLVPQWGAIDVVTAKTLVLNTNAVATPTDIASNANNRVFFELVLRNSNVTP